MRHTLRVLLISTLAVALSAVSQSSSAQVVPSTSAPGVLVDVFGHKMNIRCVGSANGKPTVILEAGGGATSSTWSSVQELLSPSVRSCAYDRAGLGLSEPGPAPRTMHQEVFELHELLAAAKVSGPVVLVGQSIGGLNVRVYAEQYGADVAGVVLVDPTHESSVLYNLRLAGWVRIRELAKARAVPEPRREGKVSTQYNPEEDYFAEELQQLYLARQTNPQPLGDRPLIVLSAGKRSRPPGPSDSLWAALSQQRDEQLRDLPLLSRNSKFVLDPSSGHEMQHDNPQIVVRAIEEVLEAIARGSRLAP